MTVPRDYLLVVADQLVDAVLTDRQNGRRVPVWAIDELIGLAAAGLALRQDVAEMWGEGDATTYYDRRVRVAMSGMDRPDTVP